MLILPESEIDKYIGMLRLECNPKLLKAIIKAETNPPFNMLSNRYEPHFDRDGWKKGKWKQKPYRFYAYGEGSLSIAEWLGVHHRSSEIERGDYNIPANYWLAKSHGLGQLLGATALDLGFRGEEIEIYHPLINIRLAALYLNLKLKLYNGDIPKAISAYNAGIALEISEGKFRNQLYVDRVLSYYFSNGKGLLAL